MMFCEKINAAQDFWIPEMLVQEKHGKKHERVRKNIQKWIA